jgi:hypothetical protein
MSFPSLIVRTLPDANPRRDDHSVVRSWCHADAWNRILAPGHQNHLSGGHKQNKAPVADLTLQVSSIVLKAALAT